MVLLYRQEQCEGTSQGPSFKAEVWAAVSETMMKTQVALNRPAGVSDSKTKRRWLWR